jgi:hypothetical protein
MRHSISSPHTRTNRLSRARKRFLSFQRLESRAVLDADQLFFGASSRGFYGDGSEDWCDWPDFNQHSSNSEQLRGMDLSSDKTFPQRNSLETIGDDFDFLSEFDSSDHHSFAFDDYEFYDDAFDDYAFDDDAFDDYEFDQLAFDRFPRNENAWGRESSHDSFDRHSFQSDRIELATPKPVAISTRIPESPSKPETPVVVSAVTYHFVVTNVPANDHAPATSQNSITHVPATSSRTVNTARNVVSTGSQNTSPSTSVSRTEPNPATPALNSVIPFANESPEFVENETSGLMRPDSNANNRTRESGTGPASETANLNANESARLPFGMDGMFPMSQASAGAIEVVPTDRVAMAEFLWSFGNPAYIGDSESESTAPKATEADASGPSLSRSQTSNPHTRHPRSLQLQADRIDSDAFSTSANDPWPEGMIALNINARATEEPALLAASIDPLALIQMFVRADDKYTDRSEWLPAIDGNVSLSGEDETVTSPSWIRWLQDPKLATLASFALGVVAFITARRSPETQTSIKTITLR